MSSHGLPKLIGILTHLDLVKSQATLRAQKKRLKKRFWTEVYDGAKLFYLSGVMNGRYPDREILNLSRFISVAKFRPLTFRNSHSYLLADRIEDLTPREELRQNPKMDRKVALWGYLRGIPMRAPSMASTLKIHIPGSGVDAFEVSSLAQLADPCPLPTIESEKRRKLSEKHRLVHAPFSGGAAGLLGSSAVSFDGDRVWVNTAGNFTRKSGEDGEVSQITGEGEKMVMDLQDIDHTLAEDINRTQLRLFASDAAPLALPRASTSNGRAKRNRRLAFGEDDIDVAASGDDDQSAEEMEEGSEMDFDEDDEEAGPALQNMSDDEVEEYDDGSDSEIGLDEDGEGLGFEQQDNEGDIQDYEAANLLGEDDDGKDADSGPQWKSDLGNKARALYLEAQSGRKLNLMSMIYSSNQTPEEVATLQLPTAASDSPDLGSDDEDLDEGDLFQLASTSKSATDIDAEDRFRQPYKPAALPDWQDDDVVESFRRFFVSGQDYGDGDDAETNENGFEDLEADGEDDGSDEEVGSDDDAGAAAKSKRRPGRHDAPLSREEQLAAKKERLKRKFDAEYDNSSDEEGKMDFYTEQKEEMRKRLEATEAEFAADDAETRALVEGYRPGSYVRLEFSNVPPELLEHFNPKFPLVVGGLLPHEENFGFVQVRLKKHRWHPKILKTNDPLIMSIGWRRFQTLPIYSIDDGTRNRMLKYTPEHMHCLATFYGPISAPNTGLCAFNIITNERPTFRISATGVVTDIDGSSRITKKLKLTGVPCMSLSNCIEHAAQ